MNTNTSLESQWCDKDRLFRYVQKFSFPRLAGTNGEREAVNMTVDAFKEIGFGDKEIIKEPIEFSDFYSTTLPKFIGMISLIALLIFVLSVHIYLIITYFMIGIMSLFIFLIIRGLKSPEKAGFWGEYFGNTIQCTNVIVKLPAKSIPSKEAGDIIISAHLDSKSQTFKTRWRIFSYKIWLYCGI